MPILRRLSVQSKLIFILVLVSLTAVLAVSYSSYQTARTAARDAANRQLAGVRITKTNLLKSLIGGYRDQISSFATSRTALESLTQLGQAMRKLDETPLDEAGRRKLEAFYRDTFIPGLFKTGGENAEVPRLLPVEPGAQVAQKLYIADNPHPYEKGNLLDVAPDNSEYSTAHKRFHAIFAQIANRIGLEDLMLVDSSLRVVYTYQKTTEFATNLATGPYANTNLSQGVRAMLKTGDRSAVHLADFELYRPNLGKPAAFFCAPIFDGQIPAGVIVFQMPIDRIIQVMTANGGWESEGLGKTGEVYLVGPDKLMRSRSRFMIEDPKNALIELGKVGLPQATLRQIERQGTVLLTMPVANESTRLALAGESGVHEMRDYRNVDVVSAYGPLDFLNIRWAVLAEMDSSEAYGPVAELGKKTFATAAALSLLISLVALGIATLFTRPLRALTEAARRVSAGDLDVKVQVETKDEIAELAAAFNQMTRALKDKTTQLESTLRENEELLLNVLPAPVAARLREGGNSQPQTFADVSILYANVSGLEDAPEGEGQSLEWLHQLVVAFDEAADRHSVEKLKTVGTTYQAACGLSLPRPDHHQRIVEFAQEMLNIVAMFGRERGVHLEVDVGINCGPVTGGVIGRKKFIYDLWGETINLARMLKQDGISTIQVTEAVRSRLEGQYGFERQPDLSRKNGAPIAVFRLSEHTSARAAAS